MDNFAYSFTRGFLYFFGLADNPAENIKSKIFSKSDSERLLDDWRKIGNDIRKSYEIYKTTVS